MTRIPFMLHIGVMCLAVFAGWLEARRLFAKHPGVKLESILRTSFHLYVLIPLFLLLFANNLLLQRSPHIKLGLPEVTMNPLVARSFFSHLPKINQELL